MVSEDFPFSKAKSLIEDGGDWLVELCLPMGHEQRLDDDETCLEQAVVNLDRAIEVLRTSGTEQVETGTEVHEGYVVPILETQITDPICAGAADAIEAHVKPLQAWYRGGEPYKVTPEWIAQLKGILPLSFKARLDGEAVQIDALEDAYDATLY